MKALLDADHYAFRIGCTTDDVDLKIAQWRLDEFVNNTLDAIGAEEYSVYLSGKNNFRYQVYPEYKANRIGKYRPKWEQALKQYLVDQWGAVSEDTLEGDDLCGINQKEDTIICSNDKDLNMIPGHHFNIVKYERWFIDEGTALRNFFIQLLMGDTADNLKGLAGVGIKTAEGMLLDKSPSECLQIITAAYNNEEYLEMTAKCLWIWRRPNDYWRDWIT